MLDDRIVQKRVVSSTYIAYFNIWLASGKSFMYIMKRSGPIMESCGTPDVICNTSFGLYYSNSFPLSSELCHLFQSDLIGLIKLLFSKERINLIMHYFFSITLEITRNNAIGLQLLNSMPVFKICFTINVRDSIMRHFMYFSCYKEMPS